MTEKLLTLVYEDDGIKLINTKVNQIKGEA